MNIQPKIFQKKTGFFGIMFCFKSRKIKKKKKKPTPQKKLKIILQSQFSMYGNGNVFFFGI